MAFDGEAPSYEVHTPYARYQRRLARGEIAVYVGANRLRIAGRTDTGSLVRLNWTRELTARSTLAIADDVGTAPDPFVYSCTASTFTVERDRASFDVGAGRNRERYDSVTALNRDALFGDIGVRYDFTRMYTNGETSIA